MRNCRFMAIIRRREAMKIYIDFDDVLCETGYCQNIFTKIKFFRYKRNVRFLLKLVFPYRQVQFFNLQKSFDLNDDFF